MKRNVDALNLVGVLQEMWHGSGVSFYMKSGKIRVAVCDGDDSLLDSELLDIYLIEGARRLRNQRRLNNEIH